MDRPQLEQTHRAIPRLCEQSPPLPAAPDWSPLVDADKPGSTVPNGLPDLLRR